MHKRRAQPTFTDVQVIQLEYNTCEPERRLGPLAPTEVELRWTAEVASDTSHCWKRSTVKHRLVISKA